MALADLSPTYLAWLAGFLDGEGSICLSVTLRTWTGAKNAGRQCFLIYPTVSITQGAAHFDVLYAIKDAVGFGQVYEAKNAKYARGHWQPTNRADARRLLNAVLPHLRVKRRQAESMLSALDLLESFPRNGKSMSQGQRVLPRAAAKKLAAMAREMNPKRDGSRYTKGRTEEEMNAALDRVYGPETPVQ